jgi:F-box protein 18 (helicase)
MTCLTQEQQVVVEYTKSAKDELLLVDSVAGSGKTTLLVAIAEELKHDPNVESGLYLAYNKAIATSSGKKFPSYVDCRTTHSLAYQATVRPLKLEVGFFGYKDIKEKIPYNEKYLLVEDVKEFCLSSHLTYNAYAKANKRPNAAMANKYLDLMTQGSITCTHDFYLKLFHILLATEEIEQTKYDLILLDEAGDLNEVTLEIFRLLKGNVKIAVGDPQQNIYTFNHTINCFEQLSEEGTTFRLSKSFRVPTHIAKPIEKFCKAYLDPDMEFEGTDSGNTDVVTRGYISRTNGGLINKLIELNRSRTAYGLVRKAQEIFKVPLLIAGLKYQGKIYDPAYRHVQEDVDNWYDNDKGVKRDYPTLYGYLKNKHSEDLSLMQAMSLVGKHGKGAIFEAYAEAKSHEGTKQNLMLLTAHSSKGLEFDEVTIAPDLNLSIQDLVLAIQDDPDMVLSALEREGLNLYYVACTRALVRLKGATHLIGV